MNMYQKNKIFNDVSPKRTVDKIKIGGPRLDALEKNLKPLTRADLPALILYVNAAMDNLSTKAGKSAENDLASVSEDKIEKELDGLTDAQWAHLADFLWAFQFPDPARLFAPGRTGGFDYRVFARKLLKKMYELRQFLDHIDGDGNEALICDSQLYRFIENLLRPEIERAACQSARTNPSKLLAKSLLAPHEVGAEAEKISPDKRKYEFTWRGLVFFICLALYKDQAQDFMNCFKSLRLPNRRRDENDPQLTAEDRTAMRKRRATIEAFEKAFTYFSYRRGRVSIVPTSRTSKSPTDCQETSILELEAFRNFTNLIGYLNKIPQDSFTYLELSDEWQRLGRRMKETLDAAAEHGMRPNPEKLRSRFDLSSQIRRKDRFLSLTAACCELKGLLPCLHFKRLCWTSVEKKGSNRYVFDERDLPEEERLHAGLNRHYVVDDGAIRFEWRPPNVVDDAVQNTGAIRIKTLRGSIGEQEFCRLVALARFDADGVNSQLDSYFAAYHRVLELMLNAEDKSMLSLDNPELREAIAQVIGVKDIQLPAHQKQIDLYFPFGISRFFVPPGKGMKSDQELRNQLLGDASRKIPGKIQLLLERCREFEQRVTAFEAYLDKVQEAKQSGREVKEPAVRRPSDGSCIVRVFDWLNLMIEDESHRFRQLPLAARHREAKFGDRSGDVGYQAAHKAIGLFEQNNIGVWGGQKRSKVSGKAIELVGLLRYAPGCPEPKVRESNYAQKVRALFPDLAEAIQRLKRQVEQNRKRRQRLDKDGCPMSNGFGKQILNPYTLLDLARSAVELCRTEYERMGRELERGVSPERLKAICHKVDVRMGQPLELEELRKSILGIADMEKWKMAYDVVADCRRTKARDISDVEHVIPQIRVPGGLSDRIVFALDVLKKRFVREKKIRNATSEWFEPRVNWQIVFCEQLKGIPLRQCYDAKPLLDYLLRPEARAYGKDSEDKVWNFAGSGVSGLAPKPLCTWNRVQAIWQQVGYDPVPEDREDQDRLWHRQELPKMDRTSVKTAIRRIRTIFCQDILLSTFALDFWNEVKKSRAFEQVPTKFKKDDACDVYEFFNTPVDFLLKGRKGSVVTLQMSRNDIFSMTFADVLSNRIRIVELLQREYPDRADGVFAFDQVVDMLSKRQQKERQLRLDVLAGCVRFMLGHPIASARYRQLETQIMGQNSEAAKTDLKQAICQMELAEYQKTYPNLTLEEYRKIADLRAVVVHAVDLGDDQASLLQEFEKMRAVLRRAGIPELMTHPTDRQKDRSKYHGNGKYHRGKTRRPRSAFW